jgi:hypothetical protein
VRDGIDGATGFNINNVAFQRAVYLEHPLDERVRRNGGCTLQFHRLCAAGARIEYEPAARVSHGIGDVRGMGFVRKHLDRGRDSAALYRIDDSGALRASGLVRRYGRLTFLPITARRVAIDWRSLIVEREQIGIPLAGIPLAAAVGASLRAVELVGMLSARHDLAER